jgi:enamine deaminase RidA (YjgF/YER057c/UK114 family)
MTVHCHCEKLSLREAKRRSKLKKQFQETNMNRQWITSGSTFEAQIGYSRAVVVGDWVFVSGTTGFDYATMTISDDVVTQAEQCLQNIAKALAEAGCTLDDVVRVNYVLPDGADFEPCWPVLRQHFGKAKPAAMVITAGLLDPRMKIEIEVTACKAL